MAIRVKCKCGKVFMVKDQFGGKKGRCPVCKNVLLIPVKPIPEKKAVKKEKLPLKSPTKTDVPKDPITSPAPPPTPIGKTRTHEIRQKEQIKSVPGKEPSSDKKVVDWINCPKCGTSQINSGRCNNCGAIFKKLEKVKPVPIKQPVKKPAVPQVPRHQGDQPSSSGKVDCPKCGLIQPVGTSCKRCGADISNRVVIKLKSIIPEIDENPPFGLLNKKVFILVIILIILLVVIAVVFSSIKGTSYESSRNEQGSSFEAMGNNSVPGDSAGKKQPLTDYVKLKGPPFKLEKNLQLNGFETGVYPSSPDWEKGDGYLDKGEFQKALDFYMGFASSNNSPDLRARITKAYHGLGVKSYSTGQLDDSIKYFKLALKYKKDAWYVHSDLARTYWKKKDIDQANKHFLIAIDLKPDDFGSRKDLGLLLYQSEAIPNAIFQLEQAKVLDPEDPIVLETLGLCYYNQKQLSNCTEILRSLLLVRVIKKEDRSSFQYRLGNVGLDKFLNMVLEYKLGSVKAEEFKRKMDRLSPGQLQAQFQRLLGLDSKLLILMITSNRENAAEKGYSRFQGDHFLVSYDRQNLRSQVDFGNVVYRCLKDAYRVIGQEFDYFPRKSVSVSVSMENRWSNPHFREIGEKINIPIFKIYTSMFSEEISEEVKLRFLENQARVYASSGVDVTQVRAYKKKFLDFLLDELKKIVRHEYVHFVIYNLAKGNTMPRWFHEGIAQFEEPRRIYMFRSSLKNWVGKNEFIHISQLDSYFFKDTNMKKKAYLHALLFVETIMGRYGINDVKRLLECMASGNEFENCFQETFYMTYGKLQDRAIQYAKDVLNNPQYSDYQENFFARLLFNSN